MKLTEDNLDIVSRLSKKGIYLAVAPSFLEGAIWRLIILDDVIDAVEDHVTRFIRVADVAKKYQSIIPSSSRSAIYKFLDSLVLLGMLDRTKDSEVVYKTNVAWRPESQATLLGSSGEPSSTSRVLLSPRVPIQKVRRDLNKKLLDYPDICYRNDIKNATYIILSHFGTDVDWCACQGIANPALKSYWFKAIKAKYVPDFKVLDLEIDSFWSTATRQWFNGSIAIKDDRLPLWEEIDPKFWNRFTSLRDRLALLEKVCPWKADPKPVTSTKPSNHPSGLVSTIGDLINLKKEDLQMKETKEAPKQTPGVANKTLRDNILNIINSELPAATKIKQTDSLIKGESVKDTDEEVSLLTNINICLEMNISDDVLKAVLGALLKTYVDKA